MNKPDSVEMPKPCGCPSQDEMTKLIAQLLNQESHLSTSYCYKRAVDLVAILFND